MACSCRGRSVGTDTDCFVVVVVAVVLVVLVVAVVLVVVVVVHAVLVVIVSRFRQVWYKKVYGDVNWNK